MPQHSLKVLCSAIGTGSYLTGDEAELHSLNENNSHLTDLNLSKPLLENQELEEAAARAPFLTLLKGPARSQGSGGPPLGIREGTVSISSGGA